ncbi:MAG: ABC transporter substrate-binding protein, partial [Burkholderiales bacterium]
MLALLLLTATTASGSAFAQSIKVGELNSYKLFPAFLEPYKKGWQLALEEINAAGGINGRTLQV